MRHCNEEQLQCITKFAIYDEEQRIIYPQQTKQNIFSAQASSDNNKLNVLTASIYLVSNLWTQERRTSQLPPYQDYTMTSFETNTSAIITLQRLILLQIIKPVVPHLKQLLIS